MMFDSGQSKQRWKLLSSKRKPPTGINDCDPMTTAVDQLPESAETYYVRQPKEKKSTFKRFYFQRERSMNYFQATNKL